MWYIACYDIPVDQRRTKIADILDDYGDRIQYSVFALQLDDDLCTAMLDRVHAVLDPASDSLYVFPVCGKCHKAMVIVGSKDPFVSQRTWFV